MKPVKLLIFISSVFLLTSINIIRGNYFSSITDVYASEESIKKISDIKSVTFVIWSALLVDDLRHRDINGNCPHTIRGFIIFKDKDGNPCAVDYAGVAELSSKFFYKQFRIEPTDFKSTTLADGNYAYPIEFKITYEEAPTLFRRPYEIVKFKLGNLEATCELTPNKSSSEQSSR